MPRTKKAKPTHDAGALRRSTGQLQALGLSDSAIRFYTGGAARHGMLPDAFIARVLTTVTERAATAALSGARKRS